LLKKKELLTIGLCIFVIVVGIAAFRGFYRNNNNVLQILEYPNPALRKVANPVDRINNDIVALSNDIIATLRYQTLKDFFLKRSMPRGLAAPQVGISKRLVVCGLNGEIKVLVNPEILEREGVYPRQDDCMSVRKGDKKIIQRSAFIKLKYKGLDNKEAILIARNRDAALLEHEIDHLNGVLNIDYWAAKR
jgi:peptide deformylase